MQSSSSRNRLFLVSVRFSDDDIFIFFYFPAFTMVKEHVESFEQGRCSGDLRGIQERGGGQGYVDITDRCAGLDFKKVIRENQNIFAGIQENYQNV